MPNGASPLTSHESQVQFIPETRAYLDLLHTYGCITTKSAEIYKKYGVTEQQYHVLRVLEDGGPGGLPCLEVARRLPTPGPDITRLIERMRRAGLVLRRRLDRDRRVVMIELTERGERIVQKVLPALERFHRQRLAHMSEEELDQLTRLLRKARHDEVVD